MGSQLCSNPVHFQAACHMREETRFLMFLNVALLFLFLWHYSSVLLLSMFSSTDVFAFCSSLVMSVVAKSVASLS